MRGTRRTRAHGRRKPNSNEHKRLWHQLDISAVRGPSKGATGVPTGSRRG